MNTNKNNIKEELQEIAPFLAKVKKLDEIKQEVPYTYFERMPDFNETTGTNEEHPFELNPK